MIIVGKKKKYKREEGQVREGRKTINKEVNI